MRSTANKYRGRCGTTLIEVLAGLVVLATLLAAVGVARGRFLRQWADADAKLRCARAAEALMTTWVTDDAMSVPPNASGPLEGAPNCFWQTHAVFELGAERLDSRVVRLDVIAQTTGPSQPLFSVDLLVPKPRVRAAPKP